MRKIILITIIGLLFAGTVSAQFIPGAFWRLVGTALQPMNSVWELGSAANRIAKGYFTDLDTTNLLVGGVVQGTLDLNSNDIINTGDIISATHQTYDLGTGVNYYSHAYINTIYNRTLLAVPKIMNNWGTYIYIEDDVFPFATNTYDLGSTTKVWAEGHFTTLNAVTLTDGTLTITGGDLTTSGELLISGHSSFGADAVVQISRVLDINETFDIQSGARYGAYSDVELQPAGALSNTTTLTSGQFQGHWQATQDGSVFGYVSGVLGVAITDGDGGAPGTDGDLYSLEGIWGRARHRTDADVTLAVGVKGTISQDDISVETGAIASGYSFLATCDTDKGTAGGEIDARYGLYVADTTGGGLLTDQYGIYIEDMASGSASGLTYAIYSLGGDVELTDGDFTTTGTLVAGAATFDGTFRIASGSITDTSGTIDFGDENFTSVGNITGDDVDLALGSGNITTTGQFQDGILTISDGSITGGVNGTFSQTLQAEQLTSTDDITMAGLLTNTMLAGDVNAFLIDGTTAPYTGGGTTLVSDITREWGANTFTVADTHTMENILMKFTGAMGLSYPSAQNITGRKLTIDNDSTWTNNGSVSSISLTGDSVWIDDDGTWNAYSDEYIKTVTGYNINIDNNATYSGAHGNTLTTKGINIDLDILPTDVDIQTTYGMFIDIDGNNVGSSTAYGLYIDVAGADTNRSMWLAHGHAFMDDDYQYWYFGEAQDSTIGFGGTAMRIQSNRTTSTDTIDFTAGHYNFKVPANIDVQLDFEGTTSSGQLFWMEDQDAFYFADDVGIGINDAGAKLEVLSTTDPQLRLTHTDGADEADFYVDGEGNLNITPTLQYIVLGDASNTDYGWYFNGFTSQGLIEWNEDDAYFQISGNDFTNYLKIAADGELTLVGTARVKKEIELRAAELHPPAAGNPHPTEIGVFSVTLFDDGNDESLYAQFHVPLDYVDGSDFTIHFHWAPINGNAGDVTWGIEWKAVRDDNNDVLSGAGTVGIVVDATQTLQDEMLGTGIITISGAGIVRKDIIGLRVFRDANASEVGASDTYASDAALSTIAIVYTSDRLGEAL